MGNIKTLGNIINSVSIQKRFTITRTKRTESERDGNFCSFKLELILQDLITPSVATGWEIALPLTQ